MRLLAAFEEAQLGSRSVDVEKRRGVSSKPQIRSCPKCGAKCGISAQSVTVHIKKMHPGMGKCATGRRADGRRQEKRALSYYFGTIFRAAIASSGSRISGARASRRFINLPRHGR